jgi:hypothetical protein
VEDLNSWTPSLPDDFEVRVGWLWTMRRIGPFGPNIGGRSAVLMSDLGFWAQLSYGKPAFVEDQALHIVSKIDQHDLGLGTLEADGGDEQSHMRLLLCKDMFHPCPYLRLSSVGCMKRFSPWLALWLLAIDPADSAIGCKLCFIGLRPVSSVSPPIRCCVACRDHFAKL